ncbi:YhgE/Pip domain-containing protein [Ruicaihuangia caeni]|uniref:YhgE/Pip family protein n=1 Tax=Ruicaihuangia caeni TaxID=3042517 RepID=A0AAW6TDK1_9MICO|nr:YhgE/Pip family protein [Klugiella sp. YN-L-19]MDI2099480.1 YhgE/Pip family protein [Klugiella sp. YN-L-19]
MNRIATPRRILAVIAAAAVPLAFAGLAIGAFSDAEAGVHRIPAAIVNNDQMVMQTDADGAQQPVLAGRLLVTELTGADSAGFDWTVTNDEAAAEALRDGRVSAVVTVPEDFSRSITSLGSDKPEQASIDIRTDDAHDPLTGAVLQAVSDGMVAAFGQTITQQVLAGMFDSFGQLGDSLGTAAEGARQLGTGVDGLAKGSAEATAGLESLAGGVGGYTQGVSSLSSGLASLDSGAAQLDGVAAAVNDFTGGTASLSAALSRAVAQLSANPSDPVALGTVQAISAQLEQFAAGGGRLASSTSSAIDGVQSGITRSAQGAATLAREGDALHTGATQAHQGSAALTAGAEQLANAAGELAGGLDTAAKAVPSSEGTDAEAAAAALARPVSATVDREHALDSASPAIVTAVAPAALWLGALAVFLVSAPLSHRVLQSSARLGRLVQTRLLPPTLLVAGQAVALTVMIHAAGAAPWSLVPWTLGISLLAAIAFAFIHFALMSLAGRGGLVLSLLALALQLVSSGVVFPRALLAEPFQAIAPWMPMTHFSRALQSVLTGGALTDGLAAAVALAGFAVVGLALGVAGTRSRRAAPTAAFAA